MKSVVIVAVLWCIIFNMITVHVNGQQGQPAQSATSQSNSTSSSTSQTTTTNPASGGGGSPAADGSAPKTGNDTTATGGGGGGGNATKPGAMSASGSPSNSILQNIESFDKLSMVKLALSKGELKDIATLLDNKNGTQQYTLFAPTNDAIMALAQSANTTKANQTFSEEDKEALMVAGIYYHIVPKKLLTSDIKQLALPKTLLNNSKFVNLPGGKAQRLHLMTEQIGNDKKVQVWFGLDKDGQAKKSNVVVPDIQCANGVIHIIDKVIDVPLEPSKILESGGLTRFLDALKQKGLDKKLDNTTGLTVFAPVNSAFDLAKEQDKALNTSLANLLQEGLFYIHGNSSGVIKFKKGGEAETEGGKNATAGGYQAGAANATGSPAPAQNATTGGAATGVRKLLQAIQNATTGAHTGGTTGTGTGGDGVTATKVNDTAGAGGNQTQWKLSGSFKNWKVDGVSILVHDVITKNGVIHVVDKIVGLPQAGGAAGNASNATMSCSDIKCPDGDQCCEVSIDSPENAMPRCYSPQTHVCASRGSFLCGKDAPFVCGLHCYSKSKYVCVNSLLLCPISAPNACGVACYDAKQFKCLNGNLQLLGADDKKAQCPS